MTAIVTASAPGKLVLTGEYAVLENAPAVSAATDLRVTVEISRVSGEYSELCVLNNGKRYRFVSDGGDELAWIDDPGPPGAIVDAAFSVISERGLFDDALRTIEISICTQDFYQSSGAANSKPLKKGIGSSAAIAVALAAALQTFASVEPTFELALQIHRCFQGSQGSGIDVATSWHGGLIVMSPGKLPDVQKLDWPKGLYVLPIWTGKAASTTVKLKQLDEFRTGSPDTYSRVFRSLCAAAASAADAWRSGNVATLMEDISCFADTLQQLDDAASLGIWSEPHRKLHALTNGSGVVYKPSGAGGGDFGLAFAADSAQLEQYGVHAQRLGFGINSIAWSDAGLSVSTR